MEVLENTAWKQSTLSKRFDATDVAEIIELYVSDWTCCLSSVKISSKVLNARILLSVRIGHQSGYSRADTINNNINILSDKSSIRVNSKNYRKKWNTKIQVHMNAGKSSCLHVATYCMDWIHCCEQSRLFPSPLHVSTSSRLALAGAFRSDYIAACSTALRSATEENGSGGYVYVPCPSKVKQRSSTADCLKY